MKAEWHRAKLVWLRGVTALAVVLLCALSARGQEELRTENAVEAGKEVLSETARFPWYDRAKDDVRRIDIKDRADADSKNRGSKWTKAPSTATTTSPVRPSQFGAVLQWLGITALVVLLGLIAFLIAKAFLKDEASETVVHRKLIESKADADRVEALPFQVRKASGDFLDEARRLYEARQYSEAIIYLFSYELVALDRRHLIRLAKGKTNRQYARELRARPALRSLLERTIMAFEDAFFGRKELTRERFEACWHELDAFHQHIEQPERAAA